ncbi:CBF-domain-containing protein [Tilletiaria anomala UBC 951]|uniref:CBF-domain-containing protein n=1 Tax=Tilletiaria anomala (strain ATCC 24038 / CBS 436.72 / UBC 951) TaxID=1037660 RepID=A0A066VF62_TILAU|nr:CBF-domain-containing protein [Tilletiaria anomala UBC 951]KDN40347.1 CBF-domain-containing protein [Tilletiaria anomala UBC 951]
MVRDFRPKDKGSKPNRFKKQQSAGSGAAGNGATGNRAAGNMDADTFKKTSQGGFKKPRPSFDNNKAKPSFSKDGSPGRRPFKKNDTPGFSDRNSLANNSVSDSSPFYALASKAGEKVKGNMIFTAQPLWMPMLLEPLPSQASSAPSSSQKGQATPALSEADISAMYARGERVLHEDNARYSSLLYGTGGDGHSGKQAANLGSLGTLSASDARFIASLLSSAGGGESGGSAATLSDRVSALTLLAQSSPLHNLAALDRLFGMCKKKSRQESGRATRALADWLASPGGLGPALGKGGRKLRYFRDQPLLPRVVAASRPPAGVDGGKAERSIDQHLGLFVFEDYLKKFYFHFLQLLEAQSHDTLPFVRTASVSQMFHLLRDQSEQEQNLLRLLVNKLGDNEKSVASRASGHLLELLNVHPAMKAIVAREVAQIIFQASAGKPQLPHTPEAKGKGKAASAGADAVANSKVNLHARYYGVLTLNQTMLTSKDKDVANMLVELYFDLFEGLLEQQAHVDKDERRKVGGDGEADGAAEAADGGQSAKEKRPRWKDSKKFGKGGKGSQPLKKNTMGVDEAHSKMVAAILAGVRRAFPFARLGSDIFDKHMATLFRVTHTGSFNISIQALQLIFQVAVSATPPGERADTDIRVSAISSLGDRFYRTLYDSLLDARLATSSKQAMYLNLLFKALKADEDPDRKKAFIKRICQVLCMHDPSFVCGALFLLGELFKINPGFKGMLDDPEEDDEEHFVDVKDDDEEEQDDEAGQGKQEGSALAITANGISRVAYDGRKRDPRFAGAQITCLWDILPLTQHFHPSVALNALQLLQSQDVTSNADLSLNTLSHFLDRFVYRNPKKTPVSYKGTSIMQPAEAASGRGVAGLETGVINIRGKGLAAGEFVNSEKFWKKEKDNVPVDQLFFHQFFNQKAQREGRESGKGGENANEGDDMESESEGEHTAPAENYNESDRSAADAPDGVDAGMSDTDSDEAEIWEAMKASMPGRGDMDDDMGISDEEDEDDDDLAAYDYSDSEEDEESGEPQVVEGFEDAMEGTSKEDDTESTSEAEDDEDTLADDREPQDFGNILDNDSDGDEGIFEEDEDDLLPFADFDDIEAESKGKATKRGAEDEGEAEENEKEMLSKGQKKRALKKQRKEMPVFASADDYAHMLGSDDESDM